MPIQATVCANESRVSSSLDLRRMQPNLGGANISQSESSYTTKPLGGVFAKQSAKRLPNGRMSYALDALRSRPQAQL